MAAELEKALQPERGSLLNEAPTANMYVELPGGELVQMCFMRPEPSHECSELPFLLPPPSHPVPQDLVMPVHEVVDALASEPVSSPEQWQPAVPPADDPSEIIRRVESALLCEERFPSTLAALKACDWRMAFEANPPPFRAASVPQLRRLVAAAASEELSDQLLRRLLPELLRQPSVRDEGEHVTPAAEAEPMPMLSSLSGLLLELLQQGSALRLEADEFDLAVVRPLQKVSAAGKSAAAEATLAYVAVRQPNANSDATGERLVWSSRHTLSADK